MGRELGGATIVASGAWSSSASCTSVVVTCPAIVSSSRGGAATSVAPSPFPRRNITTVMLSLPPLWLAARTSESAASSRLAAERRIDASSSSEIMLVRPSEQIRNRSPARPASV
jgi:hypothetical protein